MPSLSMVKKRARAVVCMSNLGQWGLIWGLYLQDHNDHFPPGTVGGMPRGTWVEPLRNYYQGGGEDMRVCPTARRNEKEGGSGWFIAWDANLGFTDPPEIFRGSYGINNWMYDCPDPYLWGQDTRYNWRRSSVNRASGIPLFMDCWRWGGTPYDTNIPYSYLPQVQAEYLHGMNRFCLDRHNMKINVLFLDLSVRKVGLKEMWTLRWSKHFDTHNQQTGDNAVWPAWMN